MAVSQQQIRQVGDLRIAIAATLKRPDDTVVDLSGLDVEFTMLDSGTGAVKVSQTATGVSVTNATAGEVQYSPVAADVDTPGTYYGYFIVIESDKDDSFPVTTGEFEIVIKSLGPC